MKGAIFCRAIAYPIANENVYSNDVSLVFYMVILDSARSNNSFARGIIVWFALQLNYCLYSCFL